MVGGSVVARPLLKNNNAGPVGQATATTQVKKKGRSDLLLDDPLTVIHYKQLGSLCRHALSEM